MNIEKIREDFQILKKGVIYFDNACTPLRPNQIIEAMNDYYQNYPSCGGRSMHKLGRQTTEKYNESRKIISKHIGARKEQEIVFTRNTTEGINLVANSLGLKKGDKVLTTDREHNSNLIPWKVLEKKTGIKHKVLGSKKDMTFDLDGFRKEVGGARLVSFVHSSNLDGYTLPAKEIIEIAHENDCLVLLDGAQYAPHGELDVSKLNVDFYAFSGHKMLGPSGTGVLYGKLGLLEALDHFLVGGDTVKDSTYTDFIPEDVPERFEAGLQNYPGAIGLASAAKYLDSVGKDKIKKHENKLNKIASEGIEKIKGIKIIGPPKVEGSVRASFYLYNTEEEVLFFIEKLKEISKLR